MQRAARGKAARAWGCCLWPLAPLMFPHFAFPSPKTLQLACTWVCVCPPAVSAPAGTALRTLGTFSCSNSLPKGAELGLLNPRGRFAPQNRPVPDPGCVLALCAFLHEGSAPASTFKRSSSASPWDCELVLLAAASSGPGDVSPEVGSGPRVVTTQLILPRILYGQFPLTSLGAC